MKSIPRSLTRKERHQRIKTVEQLRAAGERSKRTSRFDLQTLNEYRDSAIGYFISYPQRCRLPKMTRDLNTDETRQLAFYDAAIAILNRMGALDVSKLATVMPFVYTEVQEVIEDQAVRYDMTKQR
jgi:hypothetical protein